MVLASPEALFDDILEFIASSPSAEELVNYHLLNIYKNA